MDAELRLYLDAKFESLEGRIADIKDDLKDHEGRLHAVEKKLWGYSGALALLSTISASSLVYILSFK